MKNNKTEILIRREHPSDGQGWYLCDPVTGEAVGSLDGTYLIFKSKFQAVEYVRENGCKPVFE